MKGNKIEIIKFVIFISIIVTTISTLVFNIDIFHKFESIDELVEILNYYKDYIIFIYLLIFCLKPFFVIIPSNILVLVAGTILNPVSAFILSIVGFYISGTIAFFLSRFLGKGFVERIVGNKIMKLDNNLRRNGFKILFFLRLPPVLPYDPLSYACGLTSIRYRDFILASLIGIMPETLCYSIIGNNFTKPFSVKFLLPIAFLIIATSFAGFFINKGKMIDKKDLK